MLNKETREVLTQLGQINPTQIITYPVTTIVAGLSIQAFLDLSKMEEEFDEIGVYDITQLNNVISVIDDPTITNSNGTLTIKNDKQNIKYNTTNIDIIESESRGKPELIDKIKSNTHLLSFTLDAKELDRLKKMSGLLKELSFLRITSKEGKTSLVIESKEKSSNTYSIEVDSKLLTEDDVEVVILMDMFKKLPNSSYEVDVHQSKKGNLVLVFGSINVPGLNIIIPKRT